MTKISAEFTDKNNWTRLTQLDQIPTSIVRLIFEQSNSPFTSFEFLSSLENSNCVGLKSGWLPQYFLYQNKQQVGLFISYQKTHSYGEYVFDWAWADAYRRNGFGYYPKLVSAIPFSPVPCSKWLSNTDICELNALNAVISQCLPNEFSGFHYLFPEQPLAQQDSEWVSREGHQFHWFNQDEDKNLLTDFDQFLSLMTARKRKNIKKERAKVRNAGIEVYWRSGETVTAEELDAFYHCYHSTYLKRGQMGYLNKVFFELLSQRLQQHVQILFCRKDQRIIAAALYLKSEDTLYGRYWGSVEDNECLHFEACYYQGIEYAIKHKLRCFNPGTQGEHKIARGFKPTKTYSYHKLTLAPFHQAIEDFCAQEITHNENYMQACEQRLPFKVSD